MQSMNDNKLDIVQLTESRFKITSEYPQMLEMNSRI